MKQNYFLLLLLCLLMFACKKEKLSYHDYYKLKNSKIVFPQSMEQCGRIKSAYLNTPYKMLVFRDSLACTPCYLKSLDNWKAFMSAFKSSRLHIVFVLIPKKNEYVSVKSILHNRKYKWSVYVDKMYEFGKSNPQIPEDDIYHCALLDKYNHVVLIGNPLKNKSIFDMIVQRVNNIINN